MNEIPNIDEIKENLKFTDQLLKLNEIKVSVHKYH